MKLEVFLEIYYSYIDYWGDEVTACELSTHGARWESVMYQLKGNFRPDLYP